MEFKDSSCVGCDYVLLQVTYIVHLRVTNPVHVTVDDATLEQFGHIVRTVLLPWCVAHIYLTLLKLQRYPAYGVNKGLYTI